MHVLTWILSGIVAGWLTRVAMRRLDHGIAVDLGLGLLGGLVGGAVFRGLGIIAPANGLTNVVTGVFGGMLVVGTARLLGHLAERSGFAERSQRVRSVVHDFEAQLGRLGEVDRRVFGNLLRRQPVTRDSAEVFAQQLTFGERVADRVASFGGSWTFIFIFLALMGLWMLANTRSAEPFDPFPFILLNLALSCLAALQAPVIMMSQNRQAAKDRVDAHNDYAVNLKAELEILALHNKLDELRDQHIRDLIALQEQQLDLLRRIDGHTGPARTTDRTS
jgi:uncharacterized membrane protein/uncharacterized membrane protein YeaQ/YmgE (transglycosylase-associated protein family)